MRRDDDGPAPPGDPALRFDRDRPADELAYLLLEQVVPMAQWFRAELARAAGLDVHELACLDALASGPRSVGFLASRTGLASSTASKVVRRLEDAGLVERGSDRDDRRGVLVARRPGAALEAVDALVAAARGEVRDRWAGDGRDADGRRAAVLVEAAAVLAGLARDRAVAADGARHRDENRRRPTWPREIAAARARAERHRAAREAHFRRWGA